MNLAFSARTLFSLLALAATPVLAQTPATPQPAPPPAHSQFHEPAPADFNDHAEFTQLFDGQSLADWEGDADLLAR